MKVSNKTSNKNFSAIKISTIDSKIEHSIFLNNDSITSMTKGWQCCKCKETMYNDELYCTWNRCNHRRCSNCRSFIN